MQLADVLEDTLGPLDLSLPAMEAESASDENFKRLKETDFLNQKVLQELTAEELDDIPHIHELSQPGDLLVPMGMWSEGEEGCSDDVEVGCVEYEIYDESLPYYPDSPGSTGDITDYSSDGSDIIITDLQNSTELINLNSVMDPSLRIKQEVNDEHEYRQSADFHNSTEAMIDLNRVMAASIKQKIKNDFKQNNNHEINHQMKQEKDYEYQTKTNQSLLPDESILTHDHCQPSSYEMEMNSSISRVEADDEQSDSSLNKSHDNYRRKRPGRKKGQTSSVYHLWEFIRDCLQDPKLCDNIIKWENRPEGIFRVIKSTEVANRWGSKKKNKTQMTYEKLSRSLRYSRKEGYFEDLPKNCGYPKKLCFKFGPKAHGWR